MTVSATREQLRRTIRSDEHSVVTELLQSTPRSQRSRQRVLAESRKLVTACRSDKKTRRHARRAVFGVWIVECRGFAIDVPGGVAVARAGR